MLNKYLMFLYQQYCKAKGIDIVNNKFDKIDYNFLNWITQNKLLSNQYLDYLKYLGITFSKSIIEVDKGRYDSIASTEMEVVSKVASSLGIENRELIIIGSTPIISSSKKNILPTTDIILTHNPYFIENLTNWNKIHNSGKYDISIGMYGSVYDEDFDEKIKYIESISKQMNDDYRIDFDTDKDNYFCTLNSNRKQKKLILTK